MREACRGRAVRRMRDRHGVPGMSATGRSSRELRERRNGPRRSAHVGVPDVRGRTPVVLTAVPDRGKQLSHGVLIEGSVLARLMGIRLLTLDATVVLVPADVSTPRSVPHRPVRAPVPSDAATGRRSRATGTRLADAVRSLNEGADLLAQARRIRSA